MSNYDTKRMLEWLADQQMIVGDYSNVELLKTIPVLWAGWECDEVAWVVAINSKPYLVHSSHGSFYFPAKEFLDEKLQEYQQTILDTNAALALLTKETV